MAPREQTMRWLSLFTLVRSKRIAFPDREVIIDQLASLRMTELAGGSLRVEGKSKARDDVANAIASPRGGPFPCSRRVARSVCVREPVRMMTEGPIGGGRKWYRRMPNGRLVPATPPNWHPRAQALDRGDAAGGPEHAGDGEVSGLSEQGMKMGKLSQFVSANKAGGKGTNDEGGTQAQPKPNRVDPRWPGVSFVSPSMIPGPDAPDGVLEQTSKIRTLAEPLTPALRTPLLALVSLVEKARDLRFSAADAYSDAFNRARALLIAGADDARGKVNVFSSPGDPLAPRQHAAESAYLDRMRSAMLSQVREGMQPAADAFAAQVVKAVEALDRALDAVEIERSIPSIAKAVSADDQARIDALKRDLARLPFEDVEELFDKLQKTGDAERLNLFEAAATAILDEFIAKPPHQRSWEMRGGQSETDLREGAVDKKLGVARSLRAKMLLAREAREPRTTTSPSASRWRRARSSTPCSVNRSVDCRRRNSAPSSAAASGATSIASRQRRGNISPAFHVRDLPGRPPEGWTRLVGWELGREPQARGMGRGGRIEQSFRRSAPAERVMGSTSGSALRPPAPSQSRRAARRDG